MGRAVVEVAVVVVHRPHRPPVRAGGAAVGRPGAAARVADERRGGGGARQVPEPLDDVPRRAGPGIGEVAGAEVPQPLRGDVGLAVPLAAAGAVVAKAVGAVDPGEVVHRRRRARAVLGVVDVAHAGARGAGVAVAAAVAAEEGGSDARVVEGEGGGEVAVGLAGAVVDRGAAAVVLVEAVAVLVQRDAGDLAGVAAAAAGAEEVHRRAVPVGVARLVEVEVGGEALAQPGRGQPAAGHLFGPVQVVELGARGVGVAGAAVSGGGAVGPPRSAEVDLAGGVDQLADGAALVVDPHVLSAQARADAGAVGEDPAGVGVGRRASGDVVGEGHRHLGFGGRRAQVDAAADAAVVVDVDELQELAAGGVHPRTPGPQLARAPELELPDGGQRASAADLVAVGGRHRQQVETPLVEPDVVEESAADIAGDDGLRRLARHLDRRRGGVRRRQVLAPELDQVAVVDPEDDPRAVDRPAAADDVEVDEPDVAVDLAGAVAVQHQVRGVDAQRRGHVLQQVAGERLQGGEVGLAGEGQRAGGGRPQTPDHVVGGQVVAGAGHPGDAGALGELQPAGAPVDGGAPLAAGVEGEGRPGVGDAGCQRRLQVGHRRHLVSRLQWVRGEGEAVEQTGLLLGRLGRRGAGPGEQRADQQQGDRRHPTMRTTHRYTSLSTARPRRAGVEMDRPEAGAVRDAGSARGGLRSERRSDRLTRRDERGASPSRRLATHLKPKNREVTI